MSKKKILHISFIKEGQRVSVKASKAGKFKFITSYMQDGRPKMKYKYLTAKEVMENDEIKNGDPVMTLDNGEKIRVFPGGDPSYLPAMSDGIIQNHDSAHEQPIVPEYKKKVQKKRYVAKKDVKDPSDTDEYDYDFGWLSDDGGF